VDQTAIVLCSDEVLVKHQWQWFNQGRFIHANKLELNKGEKALSNFEILQGFYATTPIRPNRCIRAKKVEFSLIEPE